MAQKARKARGLSASSSSLWTAIVGDFEFSDAELAILQVALEARDQYLSAKGEIDRDGLTILDRFGTPVRHPAISIESRSRDAFLAGMKALRLNTSGLQ